MAGQNYGKGQMSPEQMNAFREQQVINARIVALDKAIEMARIAGVADISKVLSDAEKVQTFLVGDVQALKPQSAIIRQVNMPADGMFKPGD